MSIKAPLRPILSFVRREGRMTSSQKYAFENYWPIFGLELADVVKPLDFNEVFPDVDNVVLEIGFGMGHSLLTQAISNPDKQYIGIEVHRPGVGKLLHEANEHKLKNLRLFKENAVEVLKRAIPDDSLTGVQLFFPDPWHKKKHHKRRIVQADFVKLIAEKLQTGGFFHIATDWDDYAQHIIEVMDKTSYFNSADNLVMSRPETKFERRGKLLGHTIHDLIFQKK